MPIKPENKDRYPKDWKKIRRRILKRAGRVAYWSHTYQRWEIEERARCECTGECGSDHRYWGYRVWVTPENLARALKESAANVAKSCESLARAGKLQRKSAGNIPMYMAVKEQQSAGQEYTQHP